MEKLVRGRPYSSPAAAPTHADVHAGRSHVAAVVEVIFNGVPRVQLLRRHRRHLPRNGNNRRASRTPHRRAGLSAERPSSSMAAARLPRGRCGGGRAPAGRWRGRHPLPAALAHGACVGPPRPGFYGDLSSDLVFNRPGLPRDGSRNCCGCVYLKHRFQCLL